MRPVQDVQSVVLEAGGAHLDTSRQLHRRTNDDTGDFLHGDGEL